MKRKFRVVFETEIEVEIDTDATSDSYPGETILSSHQNPDRFLPGATEEDVIAAVAYTVGIEGRSVGGTEGWADFPMDVVSAVVTDVYPQTVRPIQ